MLTSFWSNFGNAALKLIESAVTLFAMAYFYMAVDPSLKKHRLWVQILSGVVLGLACIMSMLSGQSFINGTIIIDTSALLLVTSAFFFGWIPATIGALISLVFHGVVLGFPYLAFPGLSAVISVLVGLVWKRILPFKKWPHFYQYYFLGLTVTIATLALSLVIIPPEIWVNAWITWLMIFIFFPFLTALICLPLWGQTKKTADLKSVEREELLIQSRIDATENTEIFTVDHTFRYISFNKRHVDHMKEEYKLLVKKGASIFDASLLTEEDKTALRKHLGESLQGHIIKADYIDKKKRCFEFQYIPLNNSEGHISGVSVFIQDVTDKKAYETHIINTANRDHLTGLFNRRYLDNNIAAIDVPENLPLTFIMADINNLKMVNDGFGHALGDKLILEVARIIEQQFAGFPYCFRTGGDEFLIVMPRTTADEGKAASLRLYSALRNQSIGEFTISAACGTATKESNEPINKCIDLAEKRMYESKFSEVPSRQTELVRLIQNKFFAAFPLEEKHATRLRTLAIAFGKHLGLSAFEIKPLADLAELHEIGKIGFLAIEKNLEASLPEGTDLWRKQVEVGYDITISSREFSPIAIDILSLHERYDGTGLPCNLKGESIPFRSRVVAILCEYDRLCNAPEGSVSLSKAEALASVERQGGLRFDPRLTASFVEFMK